MNRMSIPSVAPVAMSAAAMVQQISPFEEAILALNSNPYFIGTMMLLLNLGGRFIAMEMSKSQEQFFQNPWIRRLLIFTVLFVGTRNVVVAFWMSLLIILLIGYLFNENSSLCLFSLGSEGSSCATNSIQAPAVQMAVNQTSSGLTPEESEIFRRLSEKQSHSSTMGQPPSQSQQTPAKTKPPTDVYWENIAILKQAEGFYGNPRF